MGEAELETDTRPPNIQRKITADGKGPKGKGFPAINMANGKFRFDIITVMDTEVTLPLWQLLDRSPQIRSQLAKAMACSRSTKKSKKPVAVV